MLSGKELQICSDFILKCGKIHEPFSFCRAFLEGVDDIIPYDQSLFIMLDGNRKIARKYFQGFSDKMTKRYLEYYARSAPVEFSLDNDGYEMQGGGFVSVIDWHAHYNRRDDFIVNYIKPLRLSQTLTMTVFDLNGAPATTFCLDRLVDETFTDAEVEIAELLCAHISNLYKNMYVRPANQIRFWDDVPNTNLLTAREREVVDLLCQGYKPAYIARELNVSVNTANKHIANIYKKLGVNSKQELLVKLLGE